MAISTMFRGKCVFEEFGANILKSWEASPKKFKKGDAIAANLQSLRMFITKTSQIDLPNRQVTLLQLLAAINGKSLEGMCFRSDSFVKECMDIFVAKYPEYFPKDDSRPATVSSHKKSVSLDDILV